MQIRSVSFQNSILDIILISGRMDHSTHTVKKSYGVSWLQNQTFVDIHCAVDFITSLQDVFKNLAFCLFSTTSFVLLHSYEIWTNGFF